MIKAKCAAFHNGIVALKPVFMKSLILVMVGGAAGSALRYILGRSLPVGAGGWPWGTFAANVIGGLSMGFLAAWMLRAGEAAEPIRLIIGVGLLGGFTTFSAYSLEIVQLAQRGAMAMALGYAMTSVVLAVIAVFAGLGAGRAVFA
jgi:fluoride exporter